MDRMFRDRMEYLSGPRDQDCFLCGATASDRDEDHMVLMRGERSFVILNKYPYNAGHLMVVPFEHETELAGLHPETVNEIMKLVQKSIEALKTGMHPEAFNIGANMGEAAGAGVPGHFHFHVVPRWSGDTNFMPVLASTKVLPESLEETYRRLKPNF